MNRYNYNSKTWIFKCMKCGAGITESNFASAYEAYKAVSDCITGLWCKPCRDKTEEKTLQGGLPT